MTETEHIDKGKAARKEHRAGLICEETLISTKLSEPGQPQKTRTHQQQRRNIEIYEGTREDRDMRKRNQTKEKG